MEQTVKYQGKIFALECGCNERGGHDFNIRFSKIWNGYMEYPFKRCGKCNYYPWIILPRK